MPIAVVKQATFVISTAVMGSNDDIKADDLGVLVHKEKPVRKYRVTRDPSLLSADLTKGDGENVYHLTRIYYHHKHTPSFRCTLFYACGKYNVFDLYLLCQCCCHGLQFS